MNNIALITGSTGGIGFETANALASRDYTVILVGRNQQRGQQAEQQIRVASGHDRAYFMPVDLSSQQGVRQLAHDVQQRFSRLDVLINNVGGLVKERQTTADGIEWMLAMNHLNPFLLTHLLLPLLKASAPSRIINLTSNAHRMAQLDLDDVQGEKRFRGMQMYGQAKLLNLLTAYELGRQLDNSGVTVNIADPGGADTDMSRQGMGIFAGLMTLFGMTTKKAARSSVYLATEAEMAGISGIYIRPNLKRGKSSDISYVPELQQQAWKLTEQLLERVTV